MDQDQYLALEPDVLLGGGSTYVLPTVTPEEKRTDGIDVISAFRAKGYQVAQNVGELWAETRPKCLGLVAAEDLRHEIDRHSTLEPAIAEMAEAALRILSRGSPRASSSCSRPNTPTQQVTDTTSRR